MRLGAVRPELVSSSGQDERSLHAGVVDHAPELSAGTTVTAAYAIAAVIRSRRTLRDVHPTARSLDRSTGAAGNTGQYLDAISW